VGTQFRHWRSGKVINESPLGDDVVSRYGMPYYHIHRADLLSVLADAAHASANISVHTGSRVTSFTQNDSQVQIQTESNGHSTSHSGSALFGADGIHSVIRAQLWGAQSACFTGNIAWRLTVPSARLPEGLIRPMSTAWWGPGKHFVHYFVRTGSLVNCVCVVEKKGWEVESWTERGDSSELEEDFAGWHDDVQQLIQNGDAHSLYKWALFDRAPMRRWGRGRVSLLGDACHPTLPFMAQGAAMAIEDGAVLANCLSQSNDITAAMDRYESLRRERTAGIQQGSRRNARVFHLSGVKAWVRNRAVRVAGKHARDTLFRYNALEAGK
ncbi:MAG: FAD-dependent monooxygenase, partial [Burkholderiaceae bacterium]